MSIFKYTCENNPEGAIELARKFSNVPVRNKNEALNVMIYVMANSDQATKESFLLELREIHPDSELYRDESGVGFWNIKSEATTNDFPIDPSLAVKVEGNSPIFTAPQFIPVPTPTMNACGCGGHGAMMHASGGSTSDHKIAKLENENATKKMIFNTVIVIAITAIVYKLFIKK